MTATAEYSVELERELHRDRKPGKPGKGHIRDGLIDLAAGTAGGVACVYTGQPLDTVKVKMQAFGKMYGNSFRCFYRTFTQDGVRGLYAGTLPALAANVAENAVLFTAYGFCQKVVATARGKADVAELTPVDNAAAGSMAAVFASIALCPTELVKCRLQAMREMRATADGAASALSAAKLCAPPPPVCAKACERLRGPWSLAKQILREEGPIGFTRGLAPTFAREVPGYFFFFGGYEICRTLLTPEGKTKDEIGALKTIFSGGIGGVSFWVSVFPADVVKSRIQIQGTGSMLGTAAMVLREDGFRALYKGLGPTLIRTFFATGALFVAYEATRKSLRNVLD